MSSFDGTPFDGIRLSGTKALHSTAGAFQPTQSISVFHITVSFDGSVSVPAASLSRGPLQDFQWVGGLSSVRLLPDGERPIADAMRLALMRKSAQ